MSNTVFSMAQETQKLMGSPNIIPPATAAMQNPQFWIDRIENPDHVFMDRAEIEAFNSKNKSRSLVRENIYGEEITINSIREVGNFGGITFHLIDPLSLESMSGDELKTHLSRAVKFVDSADIWDRRHIRYPEARKRELVEDMNLGNVPDNVTPRYGLTVCHTLNRFVPTHERVYNGQYQWLDMFQNAVFETGMPVAVLHTSTRGDWLFVRSEYSYGWVPVSSIAIGKAGRLRDFSTPSEFVVAIGHKVPVYADKECTVWMNDLYMGGRLELKKQTGGGYRVLMPVRKVDSSLDMADGWIKLDAPVSVGYQQYTQRNIITTAFRLLNRPYGWGGTDHERDCVGTVRAVMKTFGIFTPRWTTFQLYHTDHVTTFPAKMPIEEKYRYLKNCPPGITVCGFNWHVTLYLGELDGTHFIIHQNGFGYHDKDGNELRVARVSVNHTELEGGADINRWTELSEFR